MTNHSFLVDENDYPNDLLDTYFLVWGKLYLATLFITELVTWRGLAAHDSYSIIIGVTAVNRLIARGGVPSKVTSIAPT